MKASQDQTIKFWSLNGLKVSDDADRQIAWGASFSLSDRRVVVDSVLPEGIAAARGFREGDIVTRIMCYLGNDRVNSVDPSTILKSLRTVPIYESLYLETQRAGKKQPGVIIIPGWEPLLTLFVDARGEWAIWTPRGYYDSSVAEGDDLFGWQINRGVNLSPRFLKAAHLRKELERPQIIRNLLTAGNVPSAIRATKQNLPANLDTVLTQAIASIPEVRIVAPLLGDTVDPGRSLKLSAAIDYPIQSSRKDFRVVAYHNGVALRNPQERDQSDRRQLMTWETSAVAGLNLVKVRVEDRRSGEFGRINFDEDSLGIATDAHPQSYRLFLLTIAAERYDNRRFRSLRFAVDDAISISKLLQSMQQSSKHQGHYQFGHAPWQLYENDISAKTVQTTINEIKEQLARANPRDLLLVFIAGHGIAIEGEYYFLPPGADTTDKKSLARTAISWSILRQLRDVGCRKVVLLDTCRAGNLRNVAMQDLSFELKAAIRPLKREEFMVVAATSFDGDSLEGGQLFPNHGAFTHSLLSGLKDSADGWTRDGVRESHQTDGSVSLLKLVSFVRSDVERITQIDGKRQQPAYAPTRLFQLFDPLLVKPNRN